MSSHSQVLHWLAGTVRKLDRILGRLLAEEAAAAAIADAAATVSVKPRIICLNKLIPHMHAFRLRSDAKEFVPSSINMSSDTVSVAEPPCTLPDAMVNVVQPRDSPLCGPWFVLPSVGTWLFRKPYPPTFDEPDDASPDAEYGASPTDVTEDSDDIVSEVHVPWTASENTSCESAAGKSTDGDSTIGEDAVAAVYSPAQMKAILDKVEQMLAKPSIQADSRNMITLRLLKKLLCEALEAHHAGRSRDSTALVARAINLMSRVEP